MAATARAVVMIGQRFEVREYPIPEPAPGTLLLRQELAGICGTDVHNWERHTFTQPMLLGHENVGVIERLGEGVECDARGRPLRVGDRVVFAPGAQGGAYGFFPAEPEPYFRGGFAEYVYLCQPETTVVKTALPAEVAVLAEPFSVGVHGVTRSEMQIGDTVIVQGSGAIGLLTLAAARMRGAGRILCVGGPARRLALARRLGADAVIDITEVRDPAQREALVREWAPVGADVVFECTGFLDALPQGLAMLRRGGTYVAMGYFVDVGSLEFNPNQMLMRKNLRLEAVWGYGGRDLFLRAFSLLERNEYPFSDLVDPILPLERAAEGFRALSGGYRLEGREVIKVALAGSR